MLHTLYTYLRYLWTCKFGCNYLVKWWVVIRSLHDTPRDVLDIRSFRCQIWPPKATFEPLFRCSLSHPIPNGNAGGIAERSFFFWQPKRIFSWHPPVVVVGRRRLMTKPPAASAGPRQQVSPHYIHIMQNVRWQILLDVKFTFDISHSQCHFTFHK